MSGLQQLLRRKKALQPTSFPGAVVAGGGVCGLLLVILLHWLPQINSTLLPQKTVAFSAAASTLSPALASIRIPKIQLTAALEEVGLTVDGAVDVPKSPLHAAWFRLGPLPGAVGSAVIVGHYGRWQNGQGSVFDNLHQLTQGDRLHITTQNGAVITFVVRKMRKYGQLASVPEVFRSRDGKAHLNLITCDGVWDQATQSYPARLVIFTDKI